jgi:cytochrome b561
MLFIGGLIVLLVAAIIAIVVLSNAGAGHPLTDFSVFGYHLTGSTGTLFLLGIAVGAVASLRLCLLLADARRTASRAVAVCDRQGIRRYEFIPPNSIQALPI